jgi:DNA-binding SARP family transcriptional activator
MSGRLTRIAEGVGALALLVSLVVGVPSALVHFVGWPLPHHLPSPAAVGRALDRHGIPAEALVDALAVVVWLTWATLVASLAVEIPAALSGRRPAHLPVAGVFQPAVGRLVAAVVVACLALAPRPAHTGTAGSAPALRTVTTRQPVAALVVDDAVFAAATHPGRVTIAAPASPAATGVGPPAMASPTRATTPAQAPVRATTYVVQRGDTLWGIAERELGDPLRWSEIYQLNVGRPQPGGTTLSDPHWIDPGWTLLLPAAAPPALVAPVAPSTTTPPTAPSPPASPDPPPAHTPAPSTTGPSSTVPARRPAEPQATNGSTYRTTRGGEPVRLPSGSVVAGSFAAGVVATVALGRLRKRHAYRYRPPEPGRDLTPVPLRPTLHHLARAARPDDEDTTARDHETVPVFPVDVDERRLDPGRLEIGTRDGGAVTVEVTDLSGTALSGPAVDDVARALLVGLLVRAVPGATEILLTDDLANRLLPGIDPDRSLRRADGAGHVARVVEAERIARTRRMAAVDAPDAIRFRHDNPENPLPLLVVLLDRVSAESLGRWAALLADASRLGIAVLFLGDSPLATTRMALDANGTVTVVDGGDQSRLLDGATLYRLRADEATEILGAVVDANQDPDEDDDVVDAQGSVTPLHPAGDDPDPVPDEPGVWPVPSDDEAGAVRPIVVEMLGPFRLAVHGEAITSGLRGRARALFAWYLLRPEGATSDEAVEALWPDTSPDQVRRQFWRPFGDLRTRLRSTGDTSLEVLEKTGEHYRPNPTEIACDLWAFQAALARAARAAEEETARAALRRAVETYRGDLLSGVGYSWVEPVRQDLHRRALDAHLRLAELDDRAGRPEMAVEVLERAIDLDRYAEEPYRRLMALHATHGRPDAVTATWQLLRRRLADLDVDMDETTANLYRSLTSPSAPSPSRSVRLSS